MHRVSYYCAYMLFYFLYLFLGRSAETWDSWCISKNTNGDACNWYTNVCTEEIKKCATNKGYDSPYHLSSHFALKSEDHSLNIWFQRQMFALWSACNVGIANIAKRERNKGAKQLDALMKVSPLYCCFVDSVHSFWLLRVPTFVRNFQYHWEHTQKTSLRGEIYILMRGLSLSWLLGRVIMSRYSSRSTLSSWFWVIVWDCPW
jgi:hypothetical protein